MVREVPAPPRRVASERVWHVPTGGSRSCATVSPNRDEIVVEVSGRLSLNPFPRPAKPVSVCSVVKKDEGEGVGDFYHRTH